MAGFIYAIPNGGMINAKKLEAVGLMSIFADIIPNFSQRQAAKGPGGGDCTLICIGDDAKSLYFKPEEQSWQQSLNGKYWVGFYNENKPNEQNLRRKKQLAGHEIELGDGSKWLVPIARIITGGSAMPQSLILGKNGEVFTEKLPQYAQFSAQAEKLWDDFRTETSNKKQEIKLSISERMKFAYEALEWNYLVGTEEINLLKLITTENLHDVLEAIIDIPTLVKVAKEMEAEKKNKEHADINDG